MLDIRRPPSLINLSLKYAVWFENIREGSAVFPRSAKASENSFELKLSKVVKCYKQDCRLIWFNDIEACFLVTQSRVICLENMLSIYAYNTQLMIIKFINLFKIGKDLFKIAHIQNI